MSGQIAAGPPEFRPDNNEKIGIKGENPYKLEYIFFPSQILYECSCKSRKSLFQMYFCRHCMAMRCRDCVSHEMDTQYCQHCLEYIPTIDPKFQKNKCATCYHCPSCLHLLSTTTLSVKQIESTEAATRKSCQLVCAFCRWSSQVFNIFESSKITNDLPEIELSQIERINQVFDHYHALASREKSEREKRRVHPRSGNAMHLLDKYGISASLSPKLTASLRAKSYLQTSRHHQVSPLSQQQSNQLSGAQSQNSSPSTLAQEKLIKDFHPPQASSEFSKDKQLDVDFHYSRDFDLNSISTIEQRLSQIELQPERVDQFHPISKSLSVKRSLRCKVCEHNLCKSEFSPVSIKFKIQLSAFYHIPELRIRPRNGDNTQTLSLKLNQWNLVECIVQNQTPNCISVKFLHICENGSDKKMDQVAPSIIDIEKQQGDKSDGEEKDGFVKNNSDGDDNNKNKEQEEYELKLPINSIQLKPKDETADIEHAPMGAPPEDENAQIMFTRAHKVGFFFKIKPLTITHNLVVTFYMNHDIVVLQGPREPDKIESMTHKLYLNLGEVVEN